MSESIGNIHPVCVVEMGEEMYPQQYRFTIVSVVDHAGQFTPYDKSKHGPQSGVSTVEERHGMFGPYQTVADAEASHFVSRRELDKYARRIDALQRLLRDARKEAKQAWKKSLYDKAVND